MLYVIPSSASGTAAAIVSRSFWSAARCSSGRDLKYASTLFGFSMLAPFDRRRLPPLIFAHDGGLGCRTSRTRGGRSVDVKLQHLRRREDRCPTQDLRPVDRDVVPVRVR